jgi:hypothetical protein
MEIFKDDSVRLIIPNKFDPDISFWEGFDACLEMVLNSLDNQESNEIAKFTVWDFIEDFKQQIIEEADLYKKDG